MPKAPRKSPGKRDVVHEWNSRDFLDRLKLVMDHIDLFWDLRLITRSEVEMLMGMSESAREYVISREDHPIFSSLNLKNDVDTQYHRDKLKAALWAVFK